MRIVNKNGKYIHYCWFGGNKLPRKLKKYMKTAAHLSSYTIRHTWATMAYYCEIHPGIISEAMGHSSIKVTETYLKPFQNEKIDNANSQVISYVKEYASIV